MSSLAPAKISQAASQNAQELRFLGSLNWDMQKLRVQTGGPSARPRPRPRPRPIEMKIEGDLFYYCQASY